MNAEEDPRRTQEALPAFRNADRVMENLTARLEKRALVWMAGRLPAWVNSDHLTVLGLVAMLGAGAAYWLARYNRIGFWLASLFLALNWFGDSLDGTLARVRKAQRPRYGFYVDKVVDCYSALFLVGGLALSGYMSAVPAAAALLAYYLLSIEVYLATYTLGRFHMSFGGLGPTELRILLVLGNVWLWWQEPVPRVGVLGQEWLVFDMGAVVAALGLLLMTLASVAQHTRELYRAEPIPGRGAPSAPSG